MSLSLSDLFKSDTRDQLVAFFLDLSEEVGLPTTSWRPGDPTRAILYLVAQKLSDLGAVIEALIRGNFLDTSTGGYLTLLAKLVYNVDRDVARAATGETTLTNATATPHTLEASELVLAHEVTNKTYRNTSPITIPASGSVTFSIYAEEVGTASNANAGDITVVVSSLIGVTATNALPVQGRDEETDPALRQRCRDKLGALSPNGPAAAYEYVAKSTSALVNRVLVLDESDTGDVTVIVASPSGEVGAEDLEIVDAAIQDAAVPATVTAVVESAVEQEVPVIAEVWAYTSANLTGWELEAAVVAQLTGYYPLIPIGGDRVTPGGAGKVYVDKLRGQIERAAEQIFHALITSPPGDVTLDANEVAVLPATTITVHLVEPT